MKGIKSYIGGMNKDGSQSKENQNQYYHLDDFRVVTDMGRSTGSLENEKGHRIAFEVPNLPIMTLTDGTVIPAQNNLQIIGWGTIVDTIVIFTTAETSADPRNTVNSYGQIWKMKFDERTGQIVNLSGGFLTVADHLVYNQKTNFTSYRRIGRVVGRYENVNTQRVYWTDNYNPVRTFNIETPNPLDVPLDNIDLIPGINFSQPVITGIGAGNLIAGIQIQFTYRLLDGGGGQSLCAPLSALYPVPAADVYSNNYGGFTGATGGKTKAVNYILRGLDTSFTSIEHIAVIYYSPNVYSVYKFAEQNIPSSGDLDVTCSDVDTAIVLTSDELNLLSSGFDRCKDLEAKDNNLIAANTTTSKFDPQLDVRAYRFNAARTALIKDANIGDISISGVTKLITSGPGTGTSWTTIDEEHDAINPYNDEASATWFTDQYKYQSDGVTLGGEGPFCKYEFITRNIPGNYFIVDPTTGPTHVSVDNWQAVDGDDAIIGQLFPNGSTYPIEKTGQYKNYAAPYNSAYFRSNARGETYRYAVVYSGRRGSTSFAHWIGDIKFPDVEDGYKLQDVDINGFPILFPLGLKITLDVSSIASEITGYYFVRVKRDEDDKTRLGTGMYMCFDKQDSSYSDSLPHRWEDANDGSSGNTNPYRITDDCEIFGSVEGSIFHLADRPGFNDPQFIAASDKGIGYLISPIGQLYGVQFKAGDWLKTNCYYNSRAVKYHLNSNTTDPDNDKSYGFYYRCHNYLAPDHGRERFQIDKQQVMQTGQFYYSSDSFIAGYTGVNNLMNASYSRDQTSEKHVPLGLGSPKIGIMIRAVPTIPHATGGGATMNWYGGGDYRNSNLGFSGDTSTDVQFKEMAYCRYITNQYGGNTFEARSQNRYMSTNHFQAVNSAIPTPLTSDVWGGDVFINYYDDEQIQMFWNKSTAFGEPFNTPVKNKLSVAVMFPCESPVNADWREGSTFAANRDTTNMAAYESNDYVYNYLWNQENTTELKFFAKDFLIKITEEHPHQLWASELKVDGELIDKWRIFKPANRTEVNGVYGPINRIINWNNKLYFYQDMAFGVIDINERTAISDAAGKTLSLGKGGIFPYYEYLSTSTGSFHQFDVVATARGLYHYDARLKKIFKYSGGESPLSDMKGLSSFLSRNITRQITGEDYTLRAIDGGPTGVHAEVDHRYNRVLFTFLMPYFLMTRTDSIQTFNANTIILLNGSYYYVNETFELGAGSGGINPDDYPITLMPEDYKPQYTVSYNELMDAFESFYGYKPSIYLQYGRRLLSASPWNRNRAYEHNIGPYGEYYGQAPCVSRLVTILGDNGNITKTFDNGEFQMEVYDTNEVDISTETMSTCRIYNEYQDTGYTAFTPGTNIRRRMRAWRFYFFRDAMDFGKSRIRHPWSILEMTWTNNNNKRIVLHDLIYSYSPAPL